MLEVFVNRRDASEYKFHVTTDLSSDSGTNYYGKYFEIDNYGSVDTLYISTEEMNSKPTIHEVKTLRVCNHSQRYNSGTNLCENLTPAGTQISYGIQDESGVACASNADEEEYKRFVGEAMCDYGCAEKKFGKN